MSDQETIQQIIQLKNALARDPDASDSEAEDIGAHFTNRGNKLKRGARTVTSTRLETPDQHMGVRLVDFHGRKYAVISKRRKVVYDEDVNSFADGSASESGAHEDAELLDDVHLDELLKPITDPTQVPTHPAISRTFNSPTLANMASETLDVIVQEKAHVTKLANLLASFLGDDPEVLKVPNMDLEDYEHIDDGPLLKEEPAASDSLVGVTSLSSTPLNSANGNGAAAPARRQNTRAQPAIDRFFAPPDLSIDRNYGIEPEAAEETRQLLQIAHQRLEEFVRCMNVIRMGFTKADRRRRQVLNWCKEMNGQDYVEEEVGIDDSHLQWGMSKPVRPPSATESRQSATERSE